MHTRTQRTLKLNNLRFVTSFAYAPTHDTPTREIDVLRARHNNAFNAYAVPRAQTLSIFSSYEGAFFDWRARIGLID